MILRRYSKSFTTIEPTLFDVCDYWFNKDQNRIRDIRPDALAQMLLLANVQPGGRYLVVDDASGMVVSGVLERLGGTNDIRCAETPVLTLHRQWSPSRNLRY